MLKAEVETLLQSYLCIIVSKKKIIIYIIMYSDFVQSYKNNNCNNNK